MTFCLVTFTFCKGRKKKLLNKLNQEKKGITMLNQLKNMTNRTIKGFYSTLFNTGNEYTALFKIPV